MTHTVTVTRNMRGELEAVNELPIPSKPGYVLSISTGKARGGVGTFLQAMKIEPSTNGFTGRSFVMFGDFTKRLTPLPGRATEKTIASVHAAVLDGIDALMAEAEAFYAKKKAATGAAQAFAAGVASAPLDDGARYAHDGGLTQDSYNALEQ